MPVETASPSFALGLGVRECRCSVCLQEAKRSGENIVPWLKWTSMASQLGGQKALYCQALAATLGSRGVGREALGPSPCGPCCNAGESRHASWQPWLQCWRFRGVDTCDRRAPSIAARAAGYRTHRTIPQYSPHNPPALQQGPQANVPFATVPTPRPPALQQGPEGNVPTAPHPELCTSAPRRTTPQH